MQLKLIGLLIHVTIVILILVHYQYLARLNEKQRMNLKSLFKVIRAQKILVKIGQDFIQVLRENINRVKRKPGRVNDLGFPRPPYF